MSELRFGGDCYLLVLAGDVEIVGLGPYSQLSPLSLGK
jgi:hypothetical protein